MANVVTGFKDPLNALRQRFGWADPVFLAWAITMAAVLGSAELFHQEYDMLIATLRILFYLTLFDLVIGIPDERTDTPNTEQLFTVLSALGAGGLGYSIEVTAGMVAGTSATVAFVVYDLRNGLSWVEITGSDAAEAAQPEASTPAEPRPGADTTDPRRTGGGFEFPGQGGTEGEELAADSPVADHPVARQSRSEQD